LTKVSPLRETVVHTEESSQRVQVLLNATP